MNNSEKNKKLKSFTNDIEAIVKQMKNGGLSIHAANGAECTLDGIRTELMELKVQNSGHQDIFKQVEKLLEDTSFAVSNISGSNCI